MVGGAGMTRAETDTRLGNPQWTDNWTVGAGLRLEIMETATADVWLCQTPVEPAKVAALTLADGFTIVGAAPAVADVAYFDRSPDAEEDGPLEVREVDGLRFARVARPVGREAVGSQAMLLTVHKHHTMLYAAGRTISVLDLGDGELLTPAWAGPSDAEPELPAGWSLEHVTLTDDLVARIPDPATVAALADGSGFHGPVPRTSIDEVTR